MSLNCLLLALFLCAGAVSGKPYNCSGEPFHVHNEVLFPCDIVWSGVPWAVNIKDPIVKEIAEFAVSEFNKQSQKELVFQNVVSGTGQIVSGRLYRLVIEVRDGSLTVNYEGAVIETPWLKKNFRNLTSFYQLI